MKSSFRAGSTFTYPTTQANTKSIAPEEPILFYLLSDSLNHINNENPRLDGVHDQPQDTHLSLKNALIDCIERISTVMTSPHIRSTVASIYPLQEWEGRVVGIEENRFIANLIDVTAREDFESSEAVIPFEEISRYDVSRMQIDSVFRWVIGYEKSIDGTRKRVSHIVFRDFPKVTKADLDEGRKFADSLLSAIHKE